MSVKNWLKASMLLPGLCLLGVPAIAQGQDDPPQQQTGDSVANAARKAREQQKTAPKPKKVIYRRRYKARRGNGRRGSGSEAMPQAG